jgi:hypothetical protein
MRTLLKIEMPWIKKARLKRNAAEKKQKDELAVTQRKIGLALANNLGEAAFKNTVYNMYSDGHRENSIEPIAIKAMSENGGSFTILTTLPCKEVACATMSVRGYPLHQIDINLSRFGEELHFLNCPYGPEFFWDISRLDDFRDLMVQKVKTYRHFPGSLT